MNIKNLKTGDILLFAPEKGSFISWAVTFLTDADVSHSAIFYNKEHETIIEETPPQVTLSTVEKYVGKRKTYVRRLKKITNLDKVIFASTIYLNDNEPFNKTGFYLVGVLMLYKKFTPDIITQRIIVKILRKIIASVANYINEQKYPGKSPMFCSQFVAQCYEDAGPEYKLHITNNKKINNHNEPDSLLNQVIALHPNANKENSLSELTKSNNKKQNAILATEEELCEELKNAFTLKNVAENTSTPLSQELVDAISDFGEIHNILYANNGSETKKRTNSFSTLKDMENMFITPGALLNNCSNLEDVGEIGSKDSIK